VSTADLRETVADLEARLVELAAALADVRGRVARATCPTHHASHDHTPAAAVLTARRQFG